MKKLFLLLILTAVGCLSNASAAIKTWDGGGANGNWSTAANWANDVAPVAGDSLVFPNVSAQYTTTNNLSSNVFLSLTVEGGNYTFGGNTLNLSDGLTVIAGNQTFNTLLPVTTSQTYTAAQNSTVTLGALFIASGFPDPFTLTLDGAGSFVIGVITGSGNLRKNGLGASLIAASGNYSGSLTVNAGAIINNANLPNSVVNVNVPHFSPTGEFQFGGIGGSGTVGATTITEGYVYSFSFDNPNSVFTVQGNLVVAPEGDVSVLIGSQNSPTDHGQIKVNGTVTLNNPLFSPAYSIDAPPPVNSTLIIINNDGTDPINGTFNSLPEGGVLLLRGNQAYRVSYVGGDGNDFTITRVARSRFDFDGDGRTDLSVFRPSSGIWYLNQSTGGFRAAAFGVDDDRIVPADYDGDNKTDIAVYRPNVGVWYILRSSDNTFSGTQFGASEDVPVPNDYDGDGRADFAVFRPSSGIWYEQRSLGNQFYAEQFGQGGDRPVVGDFDGDGLGDLTVFRDGIWYLKEGSNRNNFRSVQFGQQFDHPLSGDFDGDGKTDIAVYRADYTQNKANFYILQSSDNSFIASAFGIASDVPVVGDYDGDGKADIAVFRTANGGGTWYLNRSTAGFIGVPFGSVGDRPAPGAFDGFPIAVQ